MRAPPRFCGTNAGERDHTTFDKRLTQPSLGALALHWHYQVSGPTGATCEGDVSNAHAPNGEGTCRAGGVEPRLAHVLPPGGRGVARADGRGRRTPRDRLGRHTSR